MTENFITKSSVSNGSMENPRKAARGEPENAKRQSAMTRKIIHESVKDLIRDRAYQLYVQRGRREGHALEDWLDAELELLANR